MKTLNMLACGAALLGAVGTGSAADWPQWRGPNRDDVSEEKGLLKEWPKGGPKLVWTFKESGSGHGSPSISKGFVYFMGSDDTAKGGNEFLICLDEKTGKKVWQKEMGTAAPENGHDYSRGNGPRGTPTVDGNRIYALGAMGDLLCMETADGKVVWKKNLVKDFGGKNPQWLYSESPLIDGDKVVVTPGGNAGAIVALNKADGSTVWQSKEWKDAAHYSSIIAADVDGVRQYIQQGASSIAGIRASDGKLLWSNKDLPRKVAVIPTPVYFDHLVFATAGYGAGSELLKLSKNGTDGTSSTRVYTNKAMINHHGGVVRVGDYIYGYSDKAGWECLDFKKDSEEPLWAEKKALGKGSVTYADGHLYCYSEDKGTCVLAEANPKKWVEKGQFSLPEYTKLPRGTGLHWAHPVVSNGKLYLRDYDLLYCYDIRGAN